MTGPVDATSFPDSEAALIAAIKAGLPDVFVSNVTPSPIPDNAVIVGSSGGGRRDWGEATANHGINVYALSDAVCRALVVDVQNILAVVSNASLERVAVPVGATAIPRQTPPFQRYFAVTAHLRGQAVL